jgi:hypothetical protein
VWGRCDLHPWLCLRAKGAVDRRNRAVPPGLTLRLTEHRRFFNPDSEDGKSTDYADYTDLRG